MNEVRFDTFHDNDEEEVKKQPVRAPQPEPIKEAPAVVAKPVEKPKRRLIILVIVILAIIAAGATTLLVLQYQENERLRSPEAAAEIAQKETNALVAKVSVLMQLPNEEPVIATVEDITKLSDQPFFADAKNGDKVLIFPTASRAVIYRPSDNIIINSGPIAITAEEPANNQ